MKCVWEIVFFFLLFKGNLIIESSENKFVNSIQFREIIKFEI